MRFWKKTARVTAGATAGAAVGAAVISMATPFIATWEGKRNYAYLDIVGVPTICYGSTNGVKMGDWKSDAECLELLKKEVGEYYERLSECMPSNAPISVQASMLELAYNVGVSATCNSTAMRMVKDGNYIAACEQLDRWVYAGGKKINGLVNRRNASKEMCMKDL